ncbi:MAG: ethanolamine permease, partial [Polyangiaceae bacterium]|nr:ethanolamine permease [Polyangiaceae bacterium]
YIDLKAAPGKVAQGTLAGADVTLELTDANFIGMATGKLNPQKLYFAGDLKISGNVMASQKLEFLKKIDGEKLRAEMQAAGRLPAAAAGGAAASAAAAASPDTLTSADVFVAIRDYVEKNPDLASQLKTIFQFRLANPDSAHFIDLKEGKGSVGAGMHASPDVTLDLSNEDFLAMTSGGADPQKLYFAGKLKISGNVMASQKLMFLKKVDPKSAQEAITKARAAGGGQQAAAATTTAKAARAPEIMKALGERLTKEPALAKELGGTVAIKVGGDVWTIDDKGTIGHASVGGADLASAKAVLTMSDEDFAEVAKTGDLRGGFQRGKVRIDGDIRYAQRLGFLKGLAS